MDLNAQKEQFSRAYVQAVAAVAGYAWYVPSVDDDSVDLGIAEKGGRGTVRSPHLEAQLKCHAAQAPGGDHMSFSLKMKNYDDLRDPNVQVPRVLIVVLVPDEPDDWLVCGEPEMLLRRCGYWLSLRGLAEVKSTAEDPRVTVHVPRSQQLTPAALRIIMQRIGAGGVP
ncbi:MAG: DUF4365 domain-containing protein [Planctomycetes bacterium]|nr:DUF4365 domain-containing protein [Planctomycetota bacterium]